MESYKILIFCVIKSTENVGQNQDKRRPHGNSKTTFLTISLNEKSRENRRGRCIWRDLVRKEEENVREKVVYRDASTSFKKIVKEQKETTITSADVTKLTYSGFENALWHALQIHQIRSLRSRRSDRIRYPWKTFRGQNQGSPKIWKKLSNL